MALVDARGFDLNPRIGQGLARGIQTLGQFQLIGQRNLEAQREAGVREALGGALAPQTQPQTEQQQMLGEQTAGLGGALAQAEQPQPITTQEEKIELARRIDPAIANKQLKALGLDSASKRAEMSRFAAKIESLPPEQRFAEIEKRSQELDAQGRDSSHTRMLLDMDQDTQDKALLGVQLMDLTTKERFGVREKIEKRTGKIEEAAEVQRSVILPDGTVQIVRKDGTVEVKQPNVLDKEIVRRGQERGVDLQQRRAQGRELGKGTAKFTDKAFDTTNKLRTNNDSLRKVIESVRGGAETGPLAKKMPSFRAESVRLDQLRNRLGLDVIGSVTFGALSEGELQLALDTALPTGLDGPELIKWADDKIEAQEKLATYLENQAIFLSEKGRTRSDWIKDQRRLAKESSGQQVKPPETPTQPPAAKQRIRFDAQGNII